MEPIMATQRIKRNWKLLANGREHKLVKGKDFSSILSMRTALYNKAQDLGMQVTTRVEGDIMFIRFNKVK